MHVVWVVDVYVMVPSGLMSFIHPFCRVASLVRRGLLLWRLVRRWLPRAVGRPSVAIGVLQQVVVDALEPHPRDSRPVATTMLTSLSDHKNILRPIKVRTVSNRLSLLKQRVVMIAIRIMIWVRSQRCDCLVTWFCYHLIANQVTGQPYFRDLTHMLWKNVESVL